MKVTIKNMKKGKTMQHKKRRYTRKKQPRSIHQARKRKSTSTKKRRTRRVRKQRGGDWGIMNSIRGIQYNLVKLGNGFIGQPTVASSNPYPTERQYEMR